MTYSSTQSHVSIYNGVHLQLLCLMVVHTLHIHTDSEMTLLPPTDSTDPSFTTESPLGDTAAPSSGGTGGSLPIILGGVVGVLVFVVLLMVGVLVLVVCILTRRRRSIDKWTPEVLSERQHGRISNGTHMYSAGTGECLCLIYHVVSEVPQFTLAKH